MQDAAIEFDDFRIAVLMNCVEYKKQKNTIKLTNRPLRSYG